MERSGLSPLGFVATDYVIAVGSVKSPTDMDALFDEDMLGDDLEEWMAESSMLRRTFRNVAVIAGLIEARTAGQEKSGRQVTFNADLIYDVDRKSTRRTPVTNAHLVCRLLLEKKKKIRQHQLHKNIY